MVAIDKSSLINKKSQMDCYGFRWALGLIIKTISSIDNKR